MPLVKRILLLFVLALAAQAEEPTACLGDLLGIPYVEDGVQDERGRWTYIHHPERTQPGRGLNCSGFLIVASRRFGVGDIPVRQLRRDWDFGWDLVFNLGEGRSPKVLGPAGLEAPRGDGASLRGFPLEDRRAWASVMPNFREDRLYLASISRAPRGKVFHHHVGLILRDSIGAVWFYHTLPKGRSHRINLASEQGFQRFLAIFGPRKRILLVDIFG